MQLFQLHSVSCLSQALFCCKPNLRQAKTFPLPFLFLFPILVLQLQKATRGNAFLLTG